MHILARAMVHLARWGSSRHSEGLDAIHWESRHCTKYCTLVNNVVNNMLRAIAVREMIIDDRRGAFPSHSVRLASKWLNCQAIRRIVAGVHVTCKFDSAFKDYVNSSLSGDTFRHVNMAVWEYLLCEQGNRVRLDPTLPQVVHARHMLIEEPELVHAALHDLMVVRTPNREELAI